MIRNKKVLATVCARGGSKAVKYKNIRKLNNKPLIMYSLDIINESKYIDDYIISTDSKRILEICKEGGYKVAFLRPAALATDKVPRVEVVKHAAKWKADNEGIIFDIIVDLGVATPFKNADDVDKAIELFIQKCVDRVTSVTKAIRNPYYNMLERKDNKIALSKNIDKYINDRRDAPCVYEMNDAINVRSYKSLFSESDYIEDSDIEVYVMPRLRSIDIDEEADFIIAEAIIKGGIIDF
jgi:CMP-N,N'-diacetyllegionaminic acid synthase